MPKKKPAVIESEPRVVKRIIDHSPIIYGRKAWRINNKAPKTLAANAIDIILRIGWAAANAIPRIKSAQERSVSIGGYIPPFRNCIEKYARTREGSMGII